MVTNEQEQSSTTNSEVRNQEATDNAKSNGSGTSNRGFASMNSERHRQISAMGGRASHESGRGHEFSSEEAREAGRKGGLASHGGGRNANGKKKKEDTSTTDKKDIN